jgi:outer membrane protein
MINRRLVSVFVIAIATIAFAVGSVSAQEMKIGVFNAERIAAETARGAKLQAELEKFRSDKQKELEAVQQELQTLQQEFVNTSTSLSDAKRNELSLSIERKRTELENANRLATRELQVRAEQAQIEWQNEIISIVKRYGADNGFSLILPVEIVPYHSDSVDLTDALIAIVDTQGS